MEPLNLENNEDEDDASVERYADILTHAEKKYLKAQFRTAGVLIL